MQSEQFYKKHSELFECYDYNYERYGIGFSVALIRLNKELIKYNIDFNSMVRCSDKYLKKDERNHFFLFFGMDRKTAYQAVLNLERNLIAKYNLLWLNNIFQSAIVIKDGDKDIKDMLRICFELIDECDENQTIVTEDDL